MYAVLNKLKRKNSGFTLVEVLVAVAILSVITLALASIMGQVFKINESSQNKALAIRQVQNAGQWISRDTLQANVAPGLGGVNGFTLTLTEDLTRYYGGIKVITYSINANGELLRTEQGKTVVIATGIQYNSITPDNSAPTWFRRVGAVYELKITTVVGIGIDTVTETRYYTIEPRPDNV